MTFQVCLFSFDNNDNNYNCLLLLLHGPSMLAVKAKIYRVLYKQSSSIALMMKHLDIGQR